MNLLSPAERLSLRRIANEATDTKAKIISLDNAELKLLEETAYDVYGVARDENQKRKDREKAAREARQAATANGRTV